MCAGCMDAVFCQLQERRANSNFLKSVECKSAHAWGGVSAHGAAAARHTAASVWTVVVARGGSAVFVFVLVIHAAWFA